jgi:hypothetical protein
VYPARSTRLTACRTGRMLRPSNVNSPLWRIASSPVRVAVRPARAYATAPSSLAPVTAGLHAYSPARSSHAATAGPHASGSPIGSPAARPKPFTNRYDTADLPVGENVARWSRRVAR